jgi:ureidoglycolate hydrolase
VPPEVKRTHLKDFPIHCVEYHPQMRREFIAIPLSHQSATGHGVQVITAPTSPSAAQQGNQGTALVVRKLTSFPSSYDSAPSGKPSSCNTAYFRCAPRPLSTDEKGRQKLKVKVFERHPYTRQAFLPMGRDAKQRAYVVITAEDDGMHLLRSAHGRWKAGLAKGKGFSCDGKSGDCI